MLSLLENEFRKRKKRKFEKNASLYIGEFYSNIYKNMDFELKKDFKTFVLRFWRVALTAEKMMNGMDCFRNPLPHLTVGTKETIIRLSRPAISISAALRTSP